MKNRKLRSGQRVRITLKGRLRRINRKDDYFLYRVERDLKSFVFIPDDWIDPIRVTPGDPRIKQ